MICKALVFLLSAASLLAVNLAAQHPPPTPRSLAAAAISSHHYDNAINVLTPQLKLHPKDASLWTLRGLALDGLGKTSDSLASFDQALAINPAFVPALQGAAQTSYRNADPRAFKYVQALLVVTPSSDIANAMAAALSYLAHDCAAAIRYFKDSGDQLYHDPRALNEYADCLLKQQTPDLALTALRRGSELYPDRIDIRYNLAVAQMRMHQPTDAVRTLAPLANEHDADLLNLLAAAYMQTSQPDDAFRVLERAIEIKPSDATNYLDLAILCLEHNQEERSIKAATAGIARAKRSASLYLIRGVAYAQLAQYEKAETDFTRAAEAEPNQPHSTIAMSMLYSDRNDLPKEKELLVHQLQLTPNDAVANYLYADLLMRSGAQVGQSEFQDAKSHLIISVAQRPNSFEAQMLMGHLVEMEHNLPEALRHYEEAVRMEPENRSALDRQFILLRKLNRNEEAAQVLAHLKRVIDDSLQDENKSAARVASLPPSPPTPTQDKP